MPEVIDIAPSCTGKAREKVSCMTSLQTVCHAMPCRHTTRQLFSLSSQASLAALPAYSYSHPRPRNTDTTEFRQTPITHPAMEAGVPTAPFLAGFYHRSKGRLLAEESNRPESIPDALLRTNPYTRTAVMITSEYFYRRSKIP